MKLIRIRIRQRMPIRSDPYLQHSKRWAFGHPLYAVKNWLKMSSFLCSLGATTTLSRRSAWVAGACVTDTPTSAPRLRWTPISFSASVSATLQVSSALQCTGFEISWLPVSVKYCSDLPRSGICFHQFGLIASHLLTWGHKNLVIAHVSYL